MLLVIDMSQYSQLHKRTREQIENFIFETIKSRNMISNLELQKLISDKLITKGKRIHLTRMQLASIIRLFSPVIGKKRISKSGIERLYYIYLGDD